jgi:glutamate-1-semialdehyde 2,1-aminomutase
MRQNSRDRELRERAAAVIPGGMYGHQSAALLPDDFPQFFSRAKGTRLWDVDGNELIDLMCAYGPNLFGYGDPEINAAYIAQMQEADTMTGPTGLIVELAEAMTGMVSHADWAIFCKNGADATLIALMTARAHTHRKTVILAEGSYHGSGPWCAGGKGGVTPEDKANQVKCQYNDVESLEAAARAAGDDLAAIFATPYRHDAFRAQDDLDVAYARRAREICDATGALLVVDDVRAGLRLSRDCSWSLVGVQPDISSWGKCLANGHPISAVLGSEKAKKAAASIYTTGSFWYQAAPMAAALVTLARVRNTDYLEHMQRLGGRLRAGLDERARGIGLGFRQSGPVTMPLFLFEDDADMRMGFCFASEMLKRGVYAHPWHNMFLNAAMTEADIDLILNAAEGAFSVVKERGPSLEPNAKLAFLAH